jgi:hypothetical protein
MSDVTRILSQIESSDPSAADKLLPLVYEELRKLAAAKLAFEKPGQTLQATALVHEAFLRLVKSPKNPSGNASAHWDGRGHFFAASPDCNALSIASLKTISVYWWILTRSQAKR